MEELGFRSSLVKGDRLSTRTELTHNSSACPTELTGACGNAGRAPGSIGFVVTEDFDGLADRRKSVVSPKRVPLEVCEQVLGLYRERYYDLNIRHFQEKLKEQHGIQLSYTWVQKALQGAGLVAKRGKRGTHRRRRPRRPLPGMLLHIDGSKHYPGRCDERDLLCAVNGR